MKELLLTDPKEIEAIMKRRSKKNKTRASAFDKLLKVDKLEDLLEPWTKNRTDFDRMVDDTKSDYKMLHDFISKMKFDDKIVNKHLDKLCKMGFNLHDFYMKDGDMLSFIVRNHNEDNKLIDIVSFSKRNLGECYAYYEDVFGKMVHKYYPRYIPSKKVIVKNTYHSKCLNVKVTDGSGKVHSCKVLVKPAVVDSRIIYEFAATICINSKSLEYAIGSKTIQIIVDDIMTKKQMEQHAKSVARAALEETIADLKWRVDICTKLKSSINKAELEDKQ